MAHASFSLNPTPTPMAPSLVGHRKALPEDNSALPEWLGEHGIVRS